MIKACMMQFRRLVLVYFFFILVLVSFKVECVNCYGIDESHGSVCSGNGECFATDVCVCDQFYTGPKCSLDSRTISNRKKWVHASNYASFSDEYICRGSRRDRGDAMYHLYWAHPCCSNPWALMMSRFETNSAITNWVGSTNYDSYSKFCLEEDYSSGYCMGCNSFDCNSISTSGFGGDVTVQQSQTRVQMSGFYCPRYGSTCASEAYFDIQCTFKRSFRDIDSAFFCDGYSQYDSTRVCSNHGICISEDSCHCNMGWTNGNSSLCSVCDGGHEGTDCDECMFNLKNPPSCDECGNNYDSTTYPLCNQCGDQWDSDSYPICESCGIRWDNPPLCDMCGSKWKNISFPYCNQCKDGRYGESCELYTCNGVEFSDIEKVCGGNGRCLDMNECECFEGFTGEFCEHNENEKLFESIFFPILGASMVTVVFVSCLFILLVTYCCCCFFCCCCVGFCLTLGKYLETRRGMSKYRKLKDVDLLLHEQLLNEKDNNPKFVISSDLFKINFSEVKVIEMVGEGGSGAIVFKGVWSNEVVAFKCFKTRNVCRKESEFEGFEKEVKILSSLSHPHVIKFYGCCLQEPRIGIVMEFCSNGDLLHFMFQERTDNFDPKEKLRICSQICSGMSYLHSRKVIHRDLKCENVLLDKHENAKIMDFGLSRIIDSGETKKTQSIGTSIYIAPELIQNDGMYSEKCDVFSFSILVWILFTENSSPFGENTFNIQYRVANSKDLRPSVEELQEKLNSGSSTCSMFEKVKDIVEKCWNHDPQDRPSFSELFGLLGASEK